MDIRNPSQGKPKTFPVKAYPDTGNTQTNTIAVTPPELPDVDEDAEISEDVKKGFPVK